MSNYMIQIKHDLDHVRYLFTILEKILERNKFWDQSGNNQNNHRRSTYFFLKASCINGITNANKNV